MEVFRARSLRFFLVEWGFRYFVFVKFYDVFGLGWVVLGRSGDYGGLGLFFWGFYLR